jgi:hypothetical protein
MLLSLVKSLDPAQLRAMTRRSVVFRPTIYSYRLRTVLQAVDDQLGRRRNEIIFSNGRVRLGMLTFKLVVSVHGFQRSPPKAEYTGRYLPGFALC